MNIGWEKALSVWWSTVWRSVIYGALAGFVLGFIGGVIAVAMQSPEKASVYGAVGGYIATIPASVLALKQALSKHLVSLATIASGATAQQGAAVDARSPSRI